MKICDIMSNNVVCVEQTEPVTAAARLFKRHNVGALPVCDEKGRLRGIVTDRDVVLRCVALQTDPDKTQVREIMSRGVITTGPMDEVDRAAKLMAGDQVRRLPVMDNGRIVGMVALGDMARSCACEMEASEALSEISSNVRRK